jgi:hypothetical protein
MGSQLAGEMHSGSIWKATRVVTEATVNIT